MLPIWTDSALASTPPGSEFRPKAGRWDAAAFLSDLTAADVALSPDKISSLREFFWFDLCAEYDALSLHRHLLAGPDVYGAEFWEFATVWLADELNHYRGFRVLYKLLYGESDESIDARLAERKPHFEPLATFFGDEFRLCCLFAYDELATTRAYHLDFELYRSLGHPKFLKFIRRLTRDESYHYQNAVALMRLHPRSRLIEVEHHVDDFVRFDLGGQAYRATFLFDHDWDHIEGGFFRETGEILKKRLRPQV